MLDKPVALDIGLMAVLVVLSVLLSGLPRLNVTFGVTVLEVAAVVVRHRRPMVTFAVGLLVALAHLIAGVGPIPADAAGLIGLYSLAADRGRRVSLAALCLALVVAAAWNVYAFYTDQANSITMDVHRDGTVTPVSPPRLDPATLSQITKGVSGLPYPRFGKSGPTGIPVTVYTESPVQTWGGFWLTAVVLLVVWLLGTATRRRRAHLAMLRQRAQELERQRDTQAKLAVVDERARISRELHDAVAHGLSVVVLQAQGGAAALDHQPERTRQALEAIVVTGRHALADIRRLLGALGDEESVRWTPPPGIARLPELCARVRATGLPLDLRIDGDPVAPPAAVDLAAYRIVQATPHLVTYP